MKCVFLATMLLGAASSACATETGYYNFSFVPNNTTANPYAVCFQVVNQGAEQPFLEQGEISGFTTGPYGSPGGYYNVVAPKTLAIFMFTYLQENAPKYQYFLTGLADEENFVHIHHAHYMIGLAAEPPPPRRGRAVSRARPGGYTIVDTGSFSVSFIGTKGCS